MVFPDESLLVSTTTDRDMLPHEFDALHAAISSDSELTGRLPGILRCCAAVGIANPTPRVGLSQKT